MAQPDANHRHGGAMAWRPGVISNEAVPARKPLAATPQLVEPVKMRCLIRLRSIVIRLKR